MFDCIATRFDKRDGAQIDCIQLFNTGGRNALGVFAAGLIAERMHLGSWNFTTDDDSLAQLTSFIARLPFGSAARATGRAWETLCGLEETAETLWLQWRIVEQLAIQLRERKQMSQDDVVELMSSDVPEVQKPLVPEMHDLLAKLEALLREHHNLELGDWRACPANGPLPPQR